MGVRDVSQLTKADAIAALGHRIDEGTLTKREALAIKLIDRMVEDPHTVTDQFFSELKQAFSDDELIELIFAGALFIWGNHFNISMRVDTDPESAYPHHLAYASATPAEGFTKGADRRRAPQGRAHGREPRGHAGRQRDEDGPTPLSGE